MNHPLTVVDRVVDVLARGAFVEDDDLAVAVLDALVVQAPTVVDQADGQLRLDWPDGFDPMRDPTQGVQYVLIDARLLTRVVELLNAARAVRAGHAELLTDDMSELDRHITTELVAEYARRMAKGMADQIYGPRKDDDAR